MSTRKDALAQAGKAHDEAWKAFGEARKSRDEAGEALYEAGAAYDAAWKAYLEARKARDEAMKAYLEAYREATREKGRGGAS